MFVQTIHIDKVVQLQYFGVYNVSGIIIYNYLRYTDMLLDVSFLFFAVILSEFNEKPRRKDWVKEKSNRWIWVRDITFWLRAFFSIYFYFLSTPSLLSTPLLCRNIFSFAPENDGVAGAPCCIFFVRSTFKTENTMYQRHAFFI